MNTRTNLDDLRADERDRVREPTSSNAPGVTWRRVASWLQFAAMSDEHADAQPVSAPTTSGGGYSVGFGAPPSSAARPDLSREREAAARAYGCEPADVGPILLMELLDLQAQVEALAVRAERLARSLPVQHGDRVRVLAMSRSLSVTARAPTAWLTRFAEEARKFLESSVLVVGGTLGSNGATTLPRTATDPDSLARWDEAGRLQALVFCAMVAGRPDGEIASLLVGAIESCPTLRSEMVDDGSRATNEQRVAALSEITKKLRTKRQRNAPTEPAADATERRAGRYVLHALVALGLPAKPNAHSLFDAAERTNLVFKKLVARIQLRPDLRSVDRSTR